MVAFTLTRQSPLYIVLFISIVALAAVIKLHGFTEPTPGDPSIYAYMSHRMLEGDLLYTELWDHKPPGVLWIFMAAELIWGYSPEAVAFLGVYFTIFSLVFIYLFLKEVAGPRAALAGALFYALASNSVTLEANQPNAELFMNFFTLVGLWAFARSKCVNPYLLIICGAAFAISTSIKTVAVFPLAALCIYLIIDYRLKKGNISPLKPLVTRLLALGLPVVVLWVAIFLYFMVAGRFDDMWEVVFDYNRRYSGSIALNTWEFFTSPRALFRESYRDVWALVLLIVPWFAISSREYEGLRKIFFIILAFSVAVEVASPGRYFAHYYQLVMPVASILSALFLRDLFARLKEQGSTFAAPATAIVFICTLAYLGFFQANYLTTTPDDLSRMKFKERHIDAREVAEIVARTTRPGEKIFNFGDETLIHLYSKRDSASGLFNLYPLRNDSAEDRTKKLERLNRDLSASPPVLIIWEDEFPDPHQTPLGAFVATNYTLAGKHKTFRFFELRRRIGGE